MAVLKIKDSGDNWHFIPANMIGDAFVTKYEGIAEVTKEKTIVNLIDIPDFDESKFYIGCAWATDSTKSTAIQNASSGSNYKYVAWTYYHVPPVFNSAFVSAVQQRTKYIDAYGSITETIRNSQYQTNYFPIYSAAIGTYNYVIYKIE